MGSFLCDITHYAHSIIWAHHHLHPMALGNQEEPLQTWSLVDCRVPSMISSLSLNQESCVFCRPPASSLHEGATVPTISKGRRISDQPYFLTTSEINLHFQFPNPKYRIILCQLIVYQLSPTWALSALSLEYQNHLRRGSRNFLQFVADAGEGREC